MQNNKVVPAQEVALWISEDGLAMPYKHVVDGVCDCRSCESKIRRIILPYAA
jgi:hypothetical protein